VRVSQWLLSLRACPSPTQSILQIIPSLSRTMHGNLPTVLEYSAGTVILRCCCICYLFRDDRGQCDPLLNFHELYPITGVIIQKAGPFQRISILKPHRTCWNVDHTKLRAVLRSQLANCRSLQTWCIISTHALMLLLRATSISLRFTVSSSLDTTLPPPVR